MNETDVVKFRHQGDGRELAHFPGFEELAAARNEMRQMAVLGVDENGIGFGNLSLRAGTSDSFYITGSGTGGIDSLEPGHCAKIVAWNLAENWLRSEGCVVPSAESLTHAVLYASHVKVRVVLHGHDRRLWHALVTDGPATDARATYGTPAMAHEVERLFRKANLAETKLFAMKGHENGVIALGMTFEEALGAFRR